MNCYINEVWLPLTTWSLWQLKFTPQGSLSPSVCCGTAFFFFFLLVYKSALMAFLDLFWQTMSRNNQHQSGVIYTSVNIKAPFSAAPVLSRSERPSAEADKEQKSHHNLLNYNPALLHFVGMSGSTIFTNLSIYCWLCPMGQKNPLTCWHIMSPTSSAIFFLWLKASVQQSNQELPIIIHHSHCCHRPTMLDLI